MGNTNFLDNIFSPPKTKQTNGVPIRHEYSITSEFSRISRYEGSIRLWEFIQVRTKFIDKSRY